MTRSVTILGSTGSVGAATLDLIEYHNRLRPESFRVVALTANSNVAELVQQARRVRPMYVAVADPGYYSQLKRELSGFEVQVIAGANAVVDAASIPADVIMASIIGAAGLRPTLAAVAQGKIVALANKECLVTAGDLFMAEVKRWGTTLLPVDSEHNAVFQVFDPAQLKAVERITLTASGGPFRTWSLEDIARATPAQACKHPNYSMGAKITVDSATLMNKGLELIEAAHLFGMTHERLDVLVHPQQIVHCLVSTIDGSVLAQLASPDMRTPIAYALGFPDRLMAPTRRLDLAELARLEFEVPDTHRFPCLKLAQNALQAGGAAPTVLNAANEVAVQAFLQGEIGFSQIADVVERTLERQNSNIMPATIEHAVMLDAAARQCASGELEFLRRRMPSFSKMEV